MVRFQIRSWDGKEFFITEKNSHKAFFSVKAWDLYLFLRDENLADRFVKWYVRKKEEELHKLKETLEKSAETQLSPGFWLGQDENGKYFARFKGKIIWKGDDISEFINSLKQGGVEK